MVNQQMGLGDYLLKGWTMTAEECLECFAPKMQHPKSGDVFCVLCWKTNKIEEMNEREEEYECEYENEENENYNEYGEDRNGELNDSGFNGEYEEVAYVTRQENEEVINSSRANNNPTEANDRDAVSREIGTLLLKGWKMLDKACLRCYTPIMKSRDGEEVCVGCHLKTKIVAKKKEEEAKNEAVVAQEAVKVEENKVLVEEEILKSSEPITEISQETSVTPKKSENLTKSSDLLESHIWKLTKELTSSGYSEYRNEKLKEMSQVLDVLEKIKKLVQ